MFVQSPTELTTAATDLILAFQSLMAVLLLRRIRTTRPMWTGLWTGFFGLLCLSSFLGAVSHGLHMAQPYQPMIWGVVYLALGIMMALFAVAAVSMRWNHELASRCLPFGITVAILFFAITQFWSDSFLLFVIYEGLVMLLALVLYTVSYWRRRDQGSAYLSAGIVAGVVAALVDTQADLRMSFLGLEFDNHGIFHLVQMVSLLLLTIGMHRSHGSVQERLTRRGLDPGQDRKTLGNTV